MRNLNLILLMLFCITNVSGQYQVIVQSGHTKPVIDIASGGVGNEYLFTASKDGTIKVWEWKTGSLITTLKSNNPYDILAIQLNTFGFLLAIYSDGKIEWWDYYDKKVKYEMRFNSEIYQVIKPIEKSKYLIIDDEYDHDTLKLSSKKILNTRSTKWLGPLPMCRLKNPIAGSHWIAGIDNLIETGFIIDYSTESNPKKNEFMIDEASNLIAIARLEGDTGIAILDATGSLHFFNNTGYHVNKKQISNSELEFLISNNKDLLVAASKTKLVVCNKSGLLLDSFPFPSSIERIEFIDHHRILAASHSKLFIYNTQTHSMELETTLNAGIVAFTFNAELNFLAYVVEENPKPVILDLNHASLLYTLTSPVWEANQIFLLDSINICLVNNKKECRILNSTTGNISEATSCSTTKPEENLYIDNNYISLSYPIITYDSIKAKKITRFVTYREIKIDDFSGKAISDCFSHDSSRLYILDAENKVNQFNRNKKDINNLQWNYKYYVSFYPLINDNWATIFNDNMYSCSKESLRWMALKYQNDDYSIEEMDLFNNRPDKALQRLGNPDTALINIYYKAFQKRLKRNGLDTNILGKVLFRPIVEVVNREVLPTTISAKKITIKVKTTCRKANLKSLHVIVNEVPIFGSAGINLSAKPTKKDEREISFELNTGINEIKIQAIDENDVHSLYDKIKINCKDTGGKKNLHLLICSVSHYQDERMNLKYAVKDGRDLAAILNQNIRYNNIFIDTLFDNKATKQQILEAKKRLINSRPEDDVLVYFSGHGLLDKDLNFYYATWNIDVKNPAEQGLSYSEIEWLMDSIPARNKLLLLDACHSGEVDKEEVSKSSIAMDKAKSTSVKKIRGSELLDAENSHLGMQTTFELMSELFSELNSNNGVIVISAAAGNSYALESDDWQNGVFTYSILQGIRSRKADINNDGEISALELKKYSGKTVQELTEGRQKPTSRVENSRLDWRLF